MNWVIRFTLPARELRIRIVPLNQHESSRLSHSVSHFVERCIPNCCDNAFNKRSEKSKLMSGHSNSKSQNTSGTHFFRDSWLSTAKGQLTTMYAADSITFFENCLNNNNSRRCKHSASFYQPDWTRRFFVHRNYQHRRCPCHNPTASLLHTLLASVQMITVYYAVSRLFHVSVEVIYTKYQFPSILIVCLCFLINNLTNYSVPQNANSDLQYQWFCYDQREQRSSIFISLTFV